MCAAKKGHTSILKYLLRKGAKTRATDRPGYLTALLYAKNYRCVEALLEAGASANESNIDGGSVLGQWVYKNTEEAERIVKLLVHRGADVNAEEDGQYVLNSAVEGGRIGMVRSLLEYGADANAEDDNGVTPLSIAQRMKRRDLVALLKRYGAE
jgi:ankyrin repeat protein